MNRILKSLFTPKIIYQTVSPISGDIKVLADKNEKRLVVGGYTQSIDKGGKDAQKRVWGKMAELALGSLGRYPKRILILGLGGGTLIHLIKGKYTNVWVDAVELDARVVEVANRFFGPFDLDGGKIYCQDGYDFVLDPANKGNYDIIFVDVYLGGNFPTKFESADFLEGLKEKLDEGGLAVFNRIANISNDTEIKALETSFLEHFKNVKSTIVGNFGNTANVVFVCKN